MSGGIRRTCHECYATGKDYDAKRQICKKCGWMPSIWKTNSLKQMCIPMSKEDIEDTIAEGR